jgi:hypothetical protein
MKSKSLSPASLKEFSSYTKIKKWSKKFNSKLNRLYSKLIVQQELK